MSHVQFKNVEANPAYFLTRIAHVHHCLEATCEVNFNMR